MLTHLKGCGAPTRISRKHSFIAAGLTLFSQMPKQKGGLTVKLGYAGRFSANARQHRPGLRRPQLLS